MSAVLSAEDVTKVFQEGREIVTVLRGVSLELSPGEVVALEGPSGSGKTTLLSILGCILTATSGRVVVDGKPIDTGRRGELPRIRKRSLGFVFQQFNLFPSLTVLENVEYALNIKGVTGASARAQAEQLLDLVGLSDRKNFYPRDLSGGQKQRVAIARALSNHPPIVLADEPTANLDSQNGTQVLELFSSLARREERALLIVTHDPKVRGFADRVVRIHDGRIVQ
ncbi:MAG: ABC transporter ATP-binding protein [Myxococcota bacterium]